MTRVRSLLLTAGAVVGSLCLLVALAGLVAGVKPLLFRSGSMSPRIPVGSLALARPVDAADLRDGDVVSVIASDGTRVTHRIVDIGGTGTTRTLTLQGDTNPTPDPETYPVRRADRVFWSLPLVGYAVAFLGSRPGLFLLGGLMFALLVVILHRDGPRDRPRGGKRKAVGAAAPLVALAITATQTTGTSAAFADSASLQSGTVAGGALVSPAGAATPCTASNGLFDGSVTLRWNGVTPGTYPPLAGYEYELRFFTRSNNAQVGSPQLQAHSGAATSVQSFTRTGTTLGNLLGLNLLSTTQLRLEVRSHLIGTSWFGPTVVSGNFTTSAVLGFVNFACT